VSTVIHEAAIKRALRILQSAATPNPRIVQSLEKARIANIVAQRLHITTVAQMEEFCERYWEVVRSSAAISQLTKVTPGSKRDKAASMTALRSESRQSA
jgi:hypothetical protein